MSWYERKTPEQILELLESIQCIENVINRRSWYMMQNARRRELEELWSGAEDISITFNDCAYRGRAAVYAMYADANERRDREKQAVMSRLHPEAALPDDSGCAVAGYMDIQTTASQVLHVAEDRKTAKGFWNSVGQGADIGSGGAEPFWHNSKFGVDLIFENGSWRIWHLFVASDYRFHAGSDWFQDNNAGTANDGGVLSDYPEPTERGDFYRGFVSGGSPDCRFHLPEPYETFLRTFSY